MFIIHIDHAKQVHWATEYQNLPAQHIDVYHDYKDFLRRFARWVKPRLKASQHHDNEGLAIVSLRKAGTVLGGFGVYSSSEIFYLAGTVRLLSRYTWRRSQCYRAIGAPHSERTAIIAI